MQRPLCHSFKPGGKVSHDLLFDLLFATAGCVFFVDCTERNGSVFSRSYFRLDTMRQPTVGLFVYIAYQNIVHYVCFPVVGGHGLGLWHGSAQWTCTRIRGQQKTTSVDVAHQGICCRSASAAVQDALSFQRPVSVRPIKRRYCALAICLRGSTDACGAGAWSGRRRQAPAVISGYVPPARGAGGWRRR